MKKNLVLLVAFLMLAASQAMAGAPKTTAEYGLTKGGKTIVLAAVLATDTADVNWARLKVISDVAGRSSLNGWKLSRLGSDDQIIGRMTAGVNVSQLRSPGFSQDIYMTDSPAAIAAIVDGLDVIMSKAK
jgi:hypothetical protein